MSVAGHALRLHATVLRGVQQCAAGLTVMLAVAETAAAEQVVELDEACLDVVPADMAEAEFANAGESINWPPPGKWNSRAVVVVCVPLPVSSDSAPTRVSTPGSRPLTRDDLPTPDWPTNTLTWPSRRFFSCSMPSP